MTKRVSEKRLVDVLSAWLREDHAVAREVRHYEKRIDLATICHKSNELWAIEAKTTNWSRAISQAIVNLAAAERSYIAIYSGYIHRVPADVLEKNGIGLIAVGTQWGDVEIIREAQPSPFVNELAKSRIRAILS